LKWIYVKVLCIMISVMLTVDLLQHHFDWYITIGDVIFFLISCLCIYAMPFITWHHKDWKLKNKVVSQSFPKLIGLLSFTVTIIPLSAWLIVAGVMEPLTLFQSARGSGSHGYSRVLLGVIIFIYSCYFSFTTVEKLIRLFKTVKN
jgi:hypothetical protein